MIAAFEVFRTASANGIDSGNILRALEVATGFAGIYAIARMRASTVRLIECATNFPLTLCVQEIVAPPNSEAETLSGWPSISVANERST